MRGASCESPAASIEEDFNAVRRADHDIDTAAIDISGRNGGGRSGDRQGLRCSESAAAIIEENVGIMVSTRSPNGCDIWNRSTLECSQSDCRDRNAREVRGSGNIEVAACGGLGATQRRLRAGAAPGVGAPSGGGLAVPGNGVWGPPPPSIGGWGPRTPNELGAGGHALQLVRGPFTPRAETSDGGEGPLTPWRVRYLEQIR